MFAMFKKLHIFLLAVSTLVQQQNDVQNTVRDIDIEQKTNLREVFSSYGVDGLS